MSSGPMAGVEDILGRTFGVVTFPAGVRRLSDTTRSLAVRVLAGAYGRRMQPAAFTLSPEDNALPPDRRAAKAIWLIAHHAPLGLEPGELLAGSSTLIEATAHQVPVAGIGGTSHTTLGFDEALKTGLRGIRDQVIDRRRRGGLSDEQTAFLDAATMCLDAMRVWHQRLVAGLTQRAETSDGADRAVFLDVRDHLLSVPENPPRTFREALQALWFLWEFQRLCGNWSGLGRLDKMLGPFLERDLARGAVTLDQARELLAHFWIKGAEWIGASTHHVGTSGDAQFYQNVVLGGVDEAGRLVINDVTYLVLDVVEELHISDFPIAVRVGPQTPERLWRRIAEVQRLGGGIVSIYHDSLVIDSMVGFGYPLAEARDFANDGCWEILVPGKTAFSYSPFDMVLVLQETLGLGPQNMETPACETFEQLYRLFCDRLRQQMEALWEPNGQAFAAGQPAPLLSLFVEDCIERATGYHQRGARYSVKSPHAGGLPDTANGLYAIKKLVFDHPRVTLAELAAILRADWEGHEALRQSIRRDLVLYGNDDDEADAMLKRVYDDYVSLCRDVPRRHGVLMPPGISTFGRELEFRKHRAAMPFGTHAHDVLAPNLAPTPGTDRRGPTAVIRSFCKLDFSRLTGGTPLDLKLHPSCLKDDSGLSALVSLMKTFIAGGGLYLQLDVVDSKVLRDAQLHPDRYPNLSVRISGWSARFTTLSREWQDMVIQRTEQVWQG